MAPDDRKGLDRLADWGQGVVRFFTHDLWTGEGISLARFQSRAFRYLRILALAGQRFVANRTLFHASGLTYITVLSLVPVLAVAFSMAKGLGAYEALRNEVIEPFLDQNLGPSAADLPEGSAEEGASALREGVDKVVHFVDATDFSVLGLFALGVMLFTVIKLLSTVERSLNEIWGVSHSRSFVRKVSDYLTLVIVTPVLVVAATGVTASTQIDRALEAARGVWDFDPLLQFLAPAFTLVLIWFAFTFLYVVLPNTRVKFGSAFFGGMVGGTLWQAIQFLHVKSQIGMARYEILYAGFAAFPLLLLWIYLSWVAVLLGAQVGFAHQNERTYRGFAIFRRLDPAQREGIAARVCVAVARRFLVGAEPPARAKLAVELGVPDQALSEILDRLVDAGLLAPTELGDVEGYLPARDTGLTTLKDVLDAVRRTQTARIPVLSELDRLVEERFAEIDAAVAEAPGNRTLRELAEELQRRLQAEPELAPEPAQRPGEARA